MKNRTNTRWLTQLALLVAVLLVMNYTPLGYLQVGPLSMSLLTIPVAIGAMTLGPVAGAKSGVQIFQAGIRMGFQIVAQRILHLA